MGDHIQLHWGQQPVLLTSTPRWHVCVNGLRWRARTTPQTRTTLSTGSDAKLHEHYGVCLCVTSQKQLHGAVAVTRGANFPQSPWSFAPPNNLLLCQYRSPAGLRVCVPGTLWPNMTASAVEQQPTPCGGHGKHVRTCSSPPSVVGCAPTAWQGWALVAAFGRLLCKRQPS